MPVISYPGITGVMACDLTTSVGITPATIQLVCSPSSTPATTGTLTIGDGTNANIVFPNCMCLEPRTEVTHDANQIIVRLADRRWQWRYGFPVNGHYNMEAGSGKLIPWTVRSPWQLAYYLLTQMGELVNAATQIDLPGGLAQPGVAMGPSDRAISASGQYLGMGQNYSLTNSNPETRWIVRPAAAALADLCEYYGRLVVLNPVDNVVYIKQIGSGAALPAGSLMRTGAVVQQDAIPQSVTAHGSPIEYQVRLRARAVAKDWDGQWRPINDVSYAPYTNSQTMQVLVQGKTFDATKNYFVYVNSVPFSVTAGTVANWNALVTNLAGQINASVNPLVVGLVTATVYTSGSTYALQIDGVNDGYEFEVMTQYEFPLGTINGSTTTDWTATCSKGPIRGSYSTNNCWQISWPTPQPIGTVLTVTVNGFPYTQAVTAAAPNGLADALDLLAAQINAASAGYTAAGGGSLFTVTNNTVGVAITVSAASSTGVAPVVTEPVGVVSAPTGWERTMPPFGVFARAVSGRLNYEEAKRLANETVMTCYQVVCEDPANTTTKSIPIPGSASVTNQFRLILQPDSPTPITPEPGNVNVLDPRTGQPFAQTTYNGYAVRRPNLVYGSVCKHIIARDGLMWRGSTYLQHNTPPRSLLPLTFSIVDPEMQVIRFSQPVYRWLGTCGVFGPLFSAGFTAQPAEIVIECGVQTLDATTYAPVAYESTVAVAGGFGPPIMRFFPDIRQEIIAAYDYWNNITGFTSLDQDAATRATAYATAVGLTFQAPAGSSVEYPGIQSIPLDGKTRQIKWSIRAGVVSTSVDQNCETSRVVLPYPQRRKAEGLPTDALRRQQNLDSDFMARAMLAKRNNAMGAVIGSLFGGGR